jgi:hypothetical protein
MLHIVYIVISLNQTMEIKIFMPPMDEYPGSATAHDDTKEHILSIAGVQVTNSFEKYLGLLALIGRSKVEAFSELKGIIWGRMYGWKERFLSQARKEILLKAVIQAIPTYTMSVFQLPKAVCKVINSMMAQF